MSLTLKIATATTIVLSKARSLVNGTVFQKVGTSFIDLTSCTITQNVSRDGKAKSRFVIRRPFTYVKGADTLVGYNYLTVEATVDPNSPLTAASELTWLGQSVCADAGFNELVQNRSNNFS